MKQHRRNTWPNIYPRKNRPGWTVDCGMINGKRERKQFTTKQEAEEYAGLRRKQREEEGRKGFELPLETRVEAAACVKKLAPYEGATITAAVDHYVVNVLVHRGGPMISKMVDDLLQQKERANLRPSSLSSLESFGVLFVERFGDRQMHAVTLPELKALCLEPSLAPRTQWNRIRFASQLFIHAQKNGWVAENLAKQIDKPRWDPKEPGILTVDQARSLLDVAAEFGLQAYIAIALFVGVRRAELLRLDWQYVRRGDREIVIPAKIAKGRARRVIKYDEALAAWLGLCAKEEGPIVEAAGFGTNFDKLRQAAGIEHWPHNGLRHSYGSYHLAMKKDEMRTAYNMGHRGTTDTLHSHYKALVSGADAEKYWKLLPKTGGPDVVR
jgi:integrase